MTKRFEEQEEKWKGIEGKVHATGSQLTGPTYAFVVFLELIEKYPDRFITGTNFVSSVERCLTKADHQKNYQNTAEETDYKRQVTDTSALNVFFKDDLFKKIVLGENYFKLTGLKEKFSAPRLCRNRI